MNYTTETGPQLTAWAVNKIKRDFPNDVALLIGYSGAAVNGDGHGECFDFFVPATERGNAFAREIHIGGINHDLYPRSWQRLEDMANLKENCQVILLYGEILYSRREEDVKRFEALRQQLKDNLQNPELIYRKALEKLDEAMTLYRNMLFEERPQQVRLAAGYLFVRLLDAVQYLDGKAAVFTHTGLLPILAACDPLPEHFETYYKTMMGAKNSSELKSVAHLMIQTAREFIAARKPAAAQPNPNTDYRYLADWYSEMSLTWRRLRYFCDTGNADAALRDAMTLQDECNITGEEFGLPELDLLSGFDAQNLQPLQQQAGEAEEQIIAFLAAKGQPLERYATLEEFLEKNP